MSQAARRLLRFLALAALCSIVSTALPAQAQTGTICKCEDIAQIQYRIQQDANVIVSYGDWVLKHPDELTESSVMQEAVLKEMNGLDGHNNALDSPFSGNGKLAATSGPFCDTTPPTMDLTPCLKHALDLHEAVHRDYCDRTHGNWHLYTATAGEEIRAYGTERNFLVAEKKLLLCNCDYYALKYSRTVNFEYKPDPNMHETLHLNSNAGNDVVMIPLNLSNGSFSGQSSGTDKLETIGTDPGFLSASNTDETDSFDVNGRMSALTVLNVATTVKTVKGSGYTQTGSVTVTGSGTKNPNYTFPPIPMQFTKVDDPFVLNRVSGSTLVAREHYESRILVRDKWIGAKAANGRGGTVDQALKVIGFVDC